MNEPSKQIFNSLKKIVLTKHKNERRLISDV